MLFADPVEVALRQCVEHGRWVERVGVLILDVALLLGRVVRPHVAVVGLDMALDGDSEPTSDACIEKVVLFDIGQEIEPDSGGP